MRLKHCALALGLTMSAASSTAQDYAISVSGFVCEFCAFGVSKNVSKLPFLDRTRYDKGIEMDPENQLVTLAVRKDAALDRAALTEAIESAGYKVEEIFVLSDTGEKAVWQP